MNARFSHVCILICVFVGAIPSVTTAQDENRFEVSGNLSYLFVDVGDSVLTDAAGAGFTGRFFVVVDDWLGFGGEIGYNDTAARLDVEHFGFFPRPKVVFPQWTALFGPRFRIIEHDRVRVGALVMAGVADSSAEFDISGGGVIVDGVLVYELPGVAVEKYALDAFRIEFGTVFAALVGAHLDFHVTDRIVWRVLEPDVLMTTYRDDWQVSLRIATGVGFEF